MCFEMRFHNCLLFTLFQHKDEINTLSGHLLHGIITHGTSKIEMGKNINKVMMGDYFSYPFIAPSTVVVALL